MVAGTDLYFFYVALVLYLAAGFLYFFTIAYKRPSLATSATITAAVGLLAHTFSLGFRWWEAGHAPWADIYESLSVFGWAIAVLTLAVVYRNRLTVVGALAFPIAFALMAFGVSQYSSPAIPLPPALRSGWLILHVSLSLVAYGAFTVAFSLAILYILQENNMRNAFRKSRLSTFYKRLPSLEALDQVCYSSVTFGFPFMTFGGLISGAIWAEQAWGRYWAWDAKETWSLITWLVYAGYLHARSTAGWRGKRAAVLAILGFAAVLFTYFGVGFFLPGLHSYLVN